jgi:hypothetical protein
MILILPFKFTVDSIFNIFTVPKQIYQIASNPDLRKNHSLEHATINVLEREFGYRNLAGYAEEDGFYIMGIQNIEFIKEAASKGLQLMKQGNEGLAIHRRCGTSITVANFLSAIIFLILLFYSGYFSIFNMILAIVIANLMGPILGQIVQKQLTTTPDVNEMEIISADFANNNFMNQPSKIFIKTEKIPYVK